jgi:hypothetical protein
VKASPCDRLRWAAAVAFDPTLNDRAKVLASVFAFIVNADSGDCYHSMATLARLTGKCERSTRLAVRELEEADWLACRQTKGRTTNFYAPKLQNSSDYNPFPSATRQEDAGLDPTNPASSYRVNPASFNTNPASDDLQPGILASLTRQDHAPKQGINKINTASVFAPKGAQPSAERKKKPTREESAKKSAEFVNVRNAVMGRKTETPVTDLTASGFLEDNTSVQIRELSVRGPM